MTGFVLQGHIVMGRNLFKYLWGRKEMQLQTQHFVQMIPREVIKTCLNLYF